MTNSLFLCNLHLLPVRWRLTTRFQPCASTLSPTLLLSISLSFYQSTPLRDTSVHPQTHAPSIFLLSKLSHLVKEHSSQAQLNGIYCRMASDIQNLLLHLKQLSEPISSDLCTNLLYLQDALCVCECVCVCVCMSVCVCMRACVCVVR